MPPPLSVDKEQVRMLVLAVGVREAARKMSLSENTVLAWSNRGGWLDHLRQDPPTMPTSMQPTVPNGHAIVAIKPVDALREVLADDSRETRLSLSRAARRMAREAEDAPLEQAGDALQVGKLAALAHGWEKDAGDRVTLAFFSIHGGALADDERVHDV